MRISDQTPVYRPAAQTRRASSGSGSFGKQLDIAATRRNTDQVEHGPEEAIWDVPGTMEPSPYIRLMCRYRDWKAKQPPQDLPDSWGPTEENLAYLKERYSGALSWEERVDALETMEQLGVITKEQKLDAMGCHAGPTFNIHDQEEMMRVIVPQMRQAIEEYHAFKRGGWDECFQDRPVGAFKTADALFAWLDQILEKENV